MTQALPVKPAVFTHVNLSGSAFQVGQMQAEALKNIPGWLEFLRSSKDTLPPLAFKQALAEFERWSPATLEEMRGFAEGVEVPLEQLFYFANTYLFQGHCSHFVVSPSVTADGHMLVGRSYEFGDDMDDKRLVTTQIDGLYRHIGSSSLLFGRHDGMNEYGLTVTTSSGGIPVGRIEGLQPPIQDGFLHWALVRALLEQCKNVEEAIALSAEMPQCGNVVLLVADRQGQAVLLEFYGPKRAMKRLVPETLGGFLCATNHYQLPELAAGQTYRMGNSVKRLETIQSYLSNKTPGFTFQDAKSLLCTPYPQGLNCHYYSEFFGTTHSMVFDVTSGTVEVCLGTPATGQWLAYNLTQPAGFQMFQVDLPQEKAPADFWAPV
jgi:predicted choloylglycine hydrolase